MAISFTRYVDITSGVGGGAGVRQRDLIGRLFTANNLVPPASFIEFDNADDVSTYFGSTSEEYARAAFYFGWISKNITKARKIAFARWVDADVAPRIYGVKGAQAVGTYTGITDGSFSLTLAGVTEDFTALNFSTATSLADVAGIIEGAIQTGTGTLWTAATVAWDAVGNRFTFVGGAVGDASISVAAGTTGTDVASLLGWLFGAVIADGSDVQTITDTLVASTDASNNFGSFLFIPTLTDAQIEEAATWNGTQNVMFQFYVPTTAIKAADYYALLSGNAGVGVTLSPTAGEYPEMVPMIILAATDYSRRNSTQNYMFQQFDLTPSVTTTTVANVFDPLRTNYYGRTQTAGQFIDFYQRGVLMGGATAPVDMNTYANEQWLKDRLGSAIMELLLSLAKVSANATGRSQLLTVIQGGVSDALFNGTISVGKPLNTTQKLYIDQLTGDPLAWTQVQSIGYWLDCVLQSYVTTDSRTEWKAVYTLVYAKDDVIRKVEGTHALI